MMKMNKKNLTIIFALLILANKGYAVTVETTFNQNAAFVWVTFKRSTIQPHNPTTPQVHPSTPQPPQPQNVRWQKLSV